MQKQSVLFLIALVLLGGALVAIYGPALNAPFTFDDSSGIVRNSSITRLWPLVGNAEYPGPLNPPKDLPTSGRPLVSLSLALNYYFGQLNPVGYRLFNLIVHLLSALLLMAIVNRTLRLEYFAGRFDRASGPLALAVALIWAVHPLQTEAIEYVVQRTELMVSFFYLATLYASLRYWAAAPSGRTVWAVVATLACLAGMASKEVMVTAPAIVLLYERTFIARSFRRAWQNSWPLYVGLFLSWGLLIYLHHAAPRSGATGFERGLPAYVWWLTQTKVLLMYLKLTVWPWPLSIHYQVPYLETPGAAWPWLAPVALLLIVTLVLLWRRNPFGFVGAWVLLILSPTLVVPIVTEVAAERRMYLPLAALITLLVAGAYWLAQQSVGPMSADPDRIQSSRRKNFAAAFAVMLLAIALSIVSFHRLSAYHDAITLWQDALVSQSDDPFVHNNLGASLMNAGRLPEAIESIQQALRLNPDFAEAHYNLGVALEETVNSSGANSNSQESLTQCIEQFELALRAKSAFPEAEYRLALALEQAGKLPDALEHLRQAIRLKPDFVEAYISLGAALSNSGQSREAIEPLEHALRLNPDLIEAHNNLGIALIRLDHLEQGIDQFQQALTLKPDYAEAHLNLGVALGKAGRLNDGIEQFQETLRLNPNSIDAYTNMAKAYTLLGRPTDAISAAEKALELAHKLGQQTVAGQIEAWLKDYRLQKAGSQNPSPWKAAPDPSS